MKVYRIKPTAGPFEGCVLYCEKPKHLASALKEAGHACLVSEQYLPRTVYDAMPSSYCSYQELFRRMIFHEPTAKGKDQRGEVI